MAQRRFGVRQLQIDGVTYLAKDGVNYSLGGDKQESVMGIDRKRHGVKVTGMVAYLDVTITDGGQGFDVKALTQIDDSIVTVDLENGKTIKFAHANYAAEGKVNAGEGEIEARFECDPEYAEEI
jgi:hypothetical protein